MKPARNHAFSCTAPRWTLTAVALPLAGLAQTTASADRVLADFDRAGRGTWQVSGAAFARGGDVTLLSLEAWQLVAARMDHSQLLSSP